METKHERAKRKKVLAYVMASTMLRKLRATTPLTNGWVDACNW